MKRAFQLEILDRPDVPDELADRAYRELTRIHRYLGDTALIVKAIRRDPLPVRRVLDIGCAAGGVLREIRRKLGVETVGVDVMPRGPRDIRLPIIRADAVRDPLPKADLAFSMYLGHHLSDQDVIGLIRNVGRFSRRFILLDLVRHTLPLALFRVFVAPFVSPIVVADGQVSIRRSYTRRELRELTAEALAGSAACFRHSVAPLYARQVIDISYGSGAGSGARRGQIQVGAAAATAP
ncbi:MAG TPA: methyltransferase domain-containing protein [Bryobacteraceae bacterium]|nr:methyltransferase domain-containing protein [Bryobacteraceae bacterium]